MYTAARIAILVSNLDSSIHFYTEILGLPLRRRIGDRWAEIEGPGIVIALRPRSSASASDAESHVFIGLWVDDLEDARRRLEERGLSFEGDPVDLEEVRLLFFSDPDRASLYLCQPLADFDQLNA
jgi:catechol 2,3-dioxygenase-like lactoylglutathione lyase family enzyme